MITAGQITMDASALGGPADPRVLRGSAGDG